MSRLRSLAAVTLCAFIFLCSTPISYAQESSKPILRVGLSVWSSPSNNKPIVDATIHALKKVYGENGISVKQYNLEDLATAIRNNQVDIFQSSAGFYRRHQDLGVRALVTAASDKFPDPNNSEGAAIVVRKDRTDIKTLADTKGMVLVANTPSGFTGFQVPMGEVAKLTDDPQKFFSKMIFTGVGHQVVDVIHAVIDRQADVGFLRLCFLEHFPELARQLKVLDPKPVGQDGCACSTERYPTWTISATSRTSPEVSRSVTATLLSMPTTPDGYYWGIANDYSNIDNLFKTLKIGPYEYLSHWTLERFWTTYWPFLMLAIVCILGLIYHSFVISKINVRQSEKLKNALEAQAKLESHSRMVAARMDELQRVGTVGLLSSMVAHELNQPLAAIVLYARGLMRLHEQGRKDQMQEVCEDISIQAQRAFDIVEKVRGYAKGNTNRSIINFSELVNKCSHDFEVSKRSNARIDIAVVPSIFVNADAMELEIVLLNLLKNSSSALRDRDDGTIDISLSPKAHRVELIIADNGHIFTHKELAVLSEPLTSSKRSGLGLGLAIVRSIVEKHGGNIVFAANTHRGLRVTVTLPIAEK